MYVDGLLTIAIKSAAAFIANIGGIAGGALNFQSPLTVTPNVSTGSLDVAMSSSAALTGSSLSVTGTVTAGGYATGSQVPSQDQRGATASLLTTDASLHTLLTLPLTAGKAGTTLYEVVGTITIPAIPVLVYAFWRRYARAVYPIGGAPRSAGSPAAQGAPGTTVVAPFLSGAIAEALSGANLLIQTTPPAPGVWTQSTAYTGTSTQAALASMDFVTASGNLYACVAPGTSSNAGTGPSGTGSGIVDGTATWAYMSAATAGIPCLWTVTWEQTAG